MHQIITVTDMNGGIHQYDGRRWEVVGQDDAKCTAAVIVKGEHFWCDLHPDHGDHPHSSADGDVIWTGPSEERDAARQQAFMNKAMKEAAR